MESLSQRPKLAGDLEAQAHRIVANEQAVKEVAALGITLVEHRLLRAQECLLALSGYQSVLTIELFEKDREKFDDSAAQAEKIIRDISILSVSFQTQLDIEYPEPSGWLLFWGRLLQWRPDTAWQRYIDTRQRRRMQRAALLKAHAEHQQMVEVYRAHIQSIRDSRLQRRQREILAADSKYQKTVHLQHEAQTDLDWLWSVEKNQASSVQARLEALCNRWNKSQYWVYNSTGEAVLSKERITIDLTLVKLRDLLHGRVTEYAKECEYLERHALQRARDESEAPA